MCDSMQDITTELWEPPKCNYLKLAYKICFFCSNLIAVGEKSRWILLKSHSRNKNLNEWGSNPRPQDKRFSAVSNELSGQVMISEVVNPAWFFKFCLSFGSRENSSLWWSVGEGPLSDCYIVTLASSPLLYQEVSLTTTTIPEPAKCLTSQTLYLANRWSTFNINSDSTRVVCSSKSSHKAQIMPISELELWS